MLKGETILCFSPTSWYSLWRNRQQIMSRLARQNHVIFVEPQRDYQFTFYENLRRNGQNLLRPATRRVTDGLTVVSVPPAIPFGLPLFGTRLARLVMPWVASANNAILVRSVKKALVGLGVKKPILWLCSPFQLGLLGKFGEKLSCYHVHDEISEYPFNRGVGNVIRRFDEGLSRKVDVVFASSQSQARRREPLNKKTFFVPNGVDFKLFSRALHPGTPIPEDIARIPRPVVGFVGFISFHIDLALLDYLADLHPNWSVVLIGPTDLEPSEVLAKLRKRLNVYFLGRRELDVLPGYLKGLDVALLPYDTTTHMMHAYPLKLNEYLAAGKAVVASPISDLGAFRDVVCVARTPRDFANGVEAALRHGSGNGSISKRLAIAEGNDWDQRVEQVSELISERLRAAREPRTGALRWQ